MNRRVTLLVAVAAAAGLTMSACSTPVGYAQGRVVGMGGPMPADGSQPFHPMMGEQVVFSQDGKNVAATITKADGTFAIKLAPGSYAVTGPCGTETIHVTPNGIAPLEFDCPIP